MSDYRVAEGHNVALVSLTVLSPQPRSIGMQPTRRNFAADGSVSDEARYVELQWDVLESAAEYQAILADFGLDDALYSPVTVYVRDGAFVYVRMNGIAVRPEPGRDVDWQIFPRSITLLVRNLEPAA